MLCGFNVTMYIKYSECFSAQRVFINKCTLLLWLINYCLCSLSHSNSPATSVLSRYVMWSLESRTQSCEISRECQKQWETDERDVRGRAAHPAVSASSYRGRAECLQTHQKH